jgi:hypothetical protein
LPPFERRPFFVCVEAPSSGKFAGEPLRFKIITMVEDSGGIPSDGRPADVLLKKSG